MISTDISLTTYAEDDYSIFIKSNKELERLLLKKLIYIAASPNIAGVALTGRLSGMRKIKVGERIWRIIWRVVKEQGEVWGIGRRDHLEIYREVERRIAILGENPETNTLAQILLKLHTSAKPILERKDIPKEILEALIYEMGLSFETIMTLSVDESISLYERYLKNT